MKVRFIYNKLPNQIAKKFQLGRRNGLVEKYILRELTTNQEEPRYEKMFVISKIRNAVRVVQ